jgi:hypothetical protein
MSFNISLFSSPEEVAVTTYIQIYSDPDGPIATMFRNSSTVDPFSYISSDAKHPRNLIGKYAVKVMPSTFIHKKEDITKFYREGPFKEFNGHSICPHCDYIHKDFSFMTEPVKIERDDHDILYAVIEKNGTVEFIKIEGNNLGKKWMEVDKSFKGTEKVNQFSIGLIKINLAYDLSHMYKEKFVFESTVPLLGLEEGAKKSAST